jgi:hypothetical protein
MLVQELQNKMTCCPLDGEIDRGRNPQSRE